MHQNKTGIIDVPYRGNKGCDAQWIGYSINNNNNKKITHKSKPYIFYIFNKFFFYIFILYK